MKEEITTSYHPGASQQVTLDDGSVVYLHKVDDKLDIHSRRSALGLIKDYKANDRILTALLYIDPDSRELHEMIQSSDKPLRSLGEEELCLSNNELKILTKVFVNILCLLFLTIHQYFPWTPRARQVQANHFFAAVQSKYYLANE